MKVNRSEDLDQSVGDLVVQAILTYAYDRERFFHIVAIVIRCCMSITHTLSDRKQQQRKKIYWKMA